MISTRSAGLLIDTVVCLTLAKWETVSGRFGGYLKQKAAVRAELIKRLVVKRPGVRAWGDMIGIPLPNILDRGACKRAAAKAPQRKRPCRFPSDRPLIPNSLLFRCLVTQ